MSDMAISIKNLSKVYKLYDRHIDRLREAIHPFKKKYHRPFYALKNMNIEIKRGEILGIVGRNGAGKSTLLKIITGVLSPSTGLISVEGNISALLELGTGFNPELTGIENIYLNGTINGYTRKEMDAKIDDIISFAEIGDFIKQPLKTYSSGMRARLGFALAINMEPEILILDEVLSVGDELFKRKCYAKMEDIFKSGCAVLYVTHSLNSINDICSRAILLDQGELILEGPPKLVTMHYQRYLYADLKKKWRIRKEILQLNRNEEEKRGFIEDVEAVKEQADSPKEKELTPTQSPFYLENFKPKSTVVIRNYDIDFYDFHIKTLDGKDVNVLITTEEYIYSYRVKFNVSADNVKFGIGINTEKGFFLGGQLQQHIHERIEEGDEFLVEWYFQCNLLAGNYYIGVGIRSMIDDKEILLYRVNDATVFKIQEDPEVECTGTVSLIRDSNITPLKTNPLHSGKNVSR